MLVGFVWLLGAQLLGETIARLFALPVPGPVLGLLMVVAACLTLPRLMALVEPAADGLIRHLSLLFVPAGVGVVQHLGLLGAQALAIAGTLVLSTLVTMAVTALVFAALAKPDPEA